MKSILVGIDLGEASKRALQQARTLAACFEGSLHLLCVVQNPFSLPWARAAPHEELRLLLGQMQHDAGAHLEQLLTSDEQRRFAEVDCVSLGGEHRREADVPVHELGRAVVRVERLAA